MSKWIVDIHGDIEGDYEIIKEYKEPKRTEEGKLPNGGWIPVSSNQLPKEYETVIASTEYGVYPEARYSKEDGWEWAYESGSDYWEPLENVLAWMPLPERYEPSESEE